MERHAGAELVTWSVVAFGIGLAAGFLLGELGGAQGPSRLARMVRSFPVPGRPSRAGERRAIVVARVRTALATDSALAGTTLDVVPVGRERIELHGWVSSRRLRAHAYRVALATAGIPVLNRLLVRGEDDGSSHAHATGESPRTA
ncbi:MAG: hypothetical protein ACRENB_15125 [Gemmatimonadales bacterium]